MTKYTKYKLIMKAMTPSGCWDNGCYEVSKNTVELPTNAVNEAVITFFPKGKKGIEMPISRIDFNGNSYLVAGEVKRIKS